MFTSLTTGLSGLQAFQTLLEGTGNNIANSGTVGFKATRTLNEDTFSQELEASSKGSSGVQIGTGVATAATVTDYTQGGFEATSTNDLAIDGQGFFVVRNADTGAEYATRVGHFHVTDDNYLVTETGERVQGFTDGTTKGDIKLDPAPGTSRTSYSVGDDGSITVKLSDNTTASRGLILLQNFSSPQALRKEGGNLYSGLTNAGPLTAAAPKSPGLGLLRSGELESSNVQLPVEFVNLITAQRGFQANSRVITTSDDILQEVMSLKR